MNVLISILGSFYSIVTKDNDLTKQSVSSAVNYSKPDSIMLDGSENNFSKDVKESLKIILLATVSVITYGIIHDLITTQINFDYFASDRTHHGPVTREYFPWVYKSNNRILYALLWGTMATWWVGLPLGILWSISARLNNSYEKTTWNQLIKPTAIFMGSMLVISLVAGVITYADSQDSFNTVAEMHGWSYLTGIVGGLMMTYYIYNKRKPLNNTIEITSNGIVLNLMP